MAESPALGPAALRPSLFLARHPAVAAVADAVWDLVGGAYLGCSIQVAPGWLLSRVVKGSGPALYRVGCGQIVHANVLGYAYKEDPAVEADVKGLIGALGPAVGSDVDHFFTAAALVCESPHEIDGRMRALALCATWDLMVSPLQKVIRGHDVRRAFAYDRRQFEVDRCGIAFGVAFCRGKPHRMTRWQVLPGCASPPP